MISLSIATGVEGYTLYLLIDPKTGIYLGIHPYLSDGLKGLKTEKILPNLVNFYQTYLISYLFTELGTTKLKLVQSVR